VSFDASYAGPNHGHAGAKQPDTPSVKDCYEAGGEQACHIAGQVTFDFFDISSILAILSNIWTKYRFVKSIPN